jgi:hypothetical protein
MIKGFQRKVRPQLQNQAAKAHGTPALLKAWSGVKQYIFGE